jgi:hypothetical protein
MKRRRRHLARLTSSEALLIRIRPPSRCRRRFHMCLTRIRNTTEADGDAHNALRSRQEVGWGSVKGSLGSLSFKQTLMCVIRQSRVPKTKMATGECPSTSFLKYPCRWPQNYAARQFSGRHARRTSEQIAVTQKWFGDKQYATPQDRQQRCGR